MISTIQNLRKELHQYPEVSGKEVNTAKRIKAFINKHYPTTIIENIGGNGLAAVYEFGKSGTTVVIRCELDALPIEEANDFEHRSTIKGVSHKCGHDGHMAIVAGLIFWLKEQTFTKGKIVLLFQPAEETGQGAYQVLQDERFQALNADYVFALHNIPKEPLHEIILMKKGFSAEVQSFKVSLKGKEAHAAEPENGINPAIAISKIIAALEGLNVNEVLKEDFAVLTPVHINMGQKSYGISPANGELHYTIRTWSSEQMRTLESAIENHIIRISQAHHLKYEIDWFEHFPASQNDTACNQLVEDAALENGFSLQRRLYPFKFGEDFGWFSKHYKTAMFGLGAGKQTPALHNADYDFPEEIIETGISVFGSVIKNVLLH